MSASTLLRLGPKDAAAAFAYAAKNPARCTFIGGWIHEGGLSDAPFAARGWLLGETGMPDEIIGLAFLSDSGILIPALGSEGGLDALVAFGRRQPELVRVIVGDREQVAEIQVGLVKGGARARLVRDQIGYAIEAPALAVSDHIAIDPATPPDLDQLVAASAAMAREEARDDPEGRNPALFRQRIEDRIRRGRDFVHKQDGKLLFKANVSALSTIGGQIEGIYTVPEARRRGIGRSGTATITRWVLDHAPRAFLLVNEDNAPARRLYAAIGYTPVIESRTVFLE